MTTASTQLGSYRVLIVEDETLLGLGLKTQLEKLGHVVVGHACNEAEARRMFQEAVPDVVLLDIRLGDTDGIELALQLLRQRRTPMIIISAYGDRALVERASEAGVFGYLIKPIGADCLQAQMAVAVCRFGEREKLLQENGALQQTLETRKLMEKAKGIFMKRLSIDEPEAHRRLQQESQKRRMSLAELARRIIESEEMMGG